MRCDETCIGGRIGGATEGRGGGGVVGWVGMGARRRGFNGVQGGETVAGGPGAAVVEVGAGDHLCGLR